MKSAPRGSGLNATCQLQHGYLRGKALGVDWVCASLRDRGVGFGIGAAAAGIEDRGLLGAEVSL